MLILKFKPLSKSEEINLDDRSQFNSHFHINDITISVLQVDKKTGMVTLGIDAPDEMVVDKVETRKYREKNIHHIMSDDFYQQLRK